ncbi:DUF4367 domain-containing protein [Lederbergia panacisoli]|uniref:DUF4367 domain-containing protein n=1 Tax=Lederbergia panacisoli TaxID=1255251 RepID=UPI00214B0276|nr:DUF4367 domain-containing protein [Lederbergia panacisoli]MCR2823744.1 DUF4367 domain-containing protein [Lederbergia panacisoli]
MPKYKEIHLDELIREVLDEKMDDFPAPSLTAAEAWSQIQKQMNEKKVTTHPLRAYRKYFLIAASILIILIFATAPQSSIAFNQLTDIFYTVQGNVVHLFGKSEGGSMKGEPAEGGFEVIEDSEIISKQMSLEEAKNAAHFPILTPKSLSEEFQLVEVTVMDGYEQKVEAVYLNYVGDDKGFILTEMPIEYQFGFGATMDNDDVTIEEIQIKGQKGSLVIYKNGDAQLIWMTQSHYFSIEGNLSKEEIITIAKSI